MDIINEQTKHVEKRFLAYLFHNKRYIAQSLGKVNKEHLPNYSNLYSLIMSYFNKYKDIITDNMIDIFFKKRNIDDNVIVTYKTLISQLRMENNFSDGEFKAVIEELREYKKRQDILTLAETIVNINPLECNSNDFTVLEDSIKSKVAKITANIEDVRKEGLLKNSIKDRIERYNQVEANPDEVLKCVPTGFKHIDDQNGGFRPGELIYVIGRKGDGKSTLLLNLAHNAWEAGKNVIIFSLEISKEDYERRFDSRAALIPSNSLKMGKLTEEEKKQYMEYLKNQQQDLSLNGKKTGMLYIVDTPPGITPAFVDSKLDSLEQTLGIKFDMVITDYAGIMQPTIQVSEKRHQQGQIALDQKIIARERECIVVSAAQKSRAGAKEKNSDSSFIAESDQVADHIDWGIDIMSTSEDYGVMQSFKTRDAEPFKFSFKKKYDRFLIQEMEESQDVWDQLG